MNWLFLKKPRARDSPSKYTGVSVQASRVGADFTKKKAVHQTRFVVGFEAAAMAAILIMGGAQQTFAMLLWIRWIRVFCMYLLASSDGMDGWDGMGDPIWRQCTRGRNGLKHIG